MRSLARLNAAFLIANVLSLHGGREAAPRRRTIAKVGVVGSNPIARSKILKMFSMLRVAQWRITGLGVRLRGGSPPSATYRPVLS